ncbi:MAG: hypothetical protein ABW195_11190 [Ilumatobacteraceae bacterium]
MTGKFVAAVQKSEIGLRPVLPLAQPIDIGHVGTVDDAGVFSHKGTISSMLGLNSLGAELPPQATDHLEVTVTSGNDVQVGFGASAKTDGLLAEFANLKAKASIDFGSSDSFFLALKGIKIRQLAEPQLLLNAMLAAYKQRPRRWHKDWVFVDRVGIASNLTVILAKEAKTTVLLKASGTAKVEAAAEVDLAAGFKFVASSKGVTQITSARKLVAFYSAYRVRDGMFSKPEITQRAYGLDLDQYPAATQRVTPVDEAYEQA